MKSLDAYLPSFEFAARYGIRVDADPKRAEKALREVTFGDVPAVRALLFLRALGAARHDDAVLEAIRRRAAVLEDVPGEGMILSLRGQFWRWRGSRGRGGDAVAVVDFRAEDGELTTETRVHVADPRSRRKFARYWRIVGPFSGLTRILVLRAAKRRAEAAR